MNQVRITDQEMIPGRGGKTRDKNERSRKAGKKRKSGKMKYAQKRLGGVD